MTIHSTTDLMRAAAKALIERDTLAIETIRAQAAAWLQPQAETDAQQLLLEAILEAACLLEGEDSDLHSMLARHTDEDAYDAGVNAAAAGRAASTNPHPKASRLHREWLDGFSDAGGVIEAA